VSAGNVLPYWDDSEDDDFEDKLMDCGLMADGTCLKAGSEYCDFDCGLLDEED
jgi:hypothetical protein